MKTLLKGGTAYTPDGFRKTDVLITDKGVLFSFSPDFASAVSNGAYSVSDVSGLYIFPGFADLHVHFREPGFIYKETVRSGSLAAAAGGYTTVCAMPNLSPPPDSPAALAPELDAIERTAAVRVLPYGTITAGRTGRLPLSDMAALAPMVCAFSDDGTGVADSETMLAAMAAAKALGKPIAAHCEDVSLLGGKHIAECAAAEKLGIRGISAESEWRQLERDIGIARQTGCRYHACHISCAESVELVRRAKAEGLPVSCETAPHYLALDNAVLPDDGAYKMNPPLRSPADREALIRGLLDGTIGAIATDHAPHSAKEKAGGLLGSAMGIPGLETAFPVLYTELVLKGRLPLEALVRLLSDSPRELFGLPGGYSGGDAAVFNLTDAFRIDPSRFETMSRVSPWAGAEVFGRLEALYLGGNKIR